MKDEVTIGATEWNTSLFPSTDYDSYILPAKKSVRAQENLDHGDQVKVTVSPVFGPD